MLHYPIHMKSYTKFVTLENMSTHDLTTLFHDYSTIYKETNSCFSFFYMYTKKSTFYNKQSLTIQCPEDISFFHFHNLILWFKKYKSIGFMINENNFSKSYYCFPDYNNIAGDTLGGYFPDGTFLSIEVPSAFLENGNLQKSSYKQQEHIFTSKDIIHFLGYNNFSNLNQENKNIIKICL